jgi:pyruvate formate lyase activating enzyme
VKAVQTPGGDGDVPSGTQALRVGGVIPFSNTDWPGRLAAVLFLQGCPWHCGYCQNPHLLPPHGAHEEDWAATLEWLATRRGLLDAVVFSGGEPTAQPALGAAIRAVRALDFAPGLHTGGAYPRRLLEVAREVDWVGLDIKAPMLAYEAVTGVPRSGYAAFASLDLMLRSGIALEVRTTVHPALTPPDMLVALARELAAAGVVRWVLQAFRPTGCASDSLIAAAPRGARIDADTVALLKAHVPEIDVR